MECGLDPPQCGCLDRTQLRGKLCSNLLAGGSIRDAAGASLVTECRWAAAFLVAVDQGLLGLQGAHPNLQRLRPAWCSQRVDLCILPSLSGSSSKACLFSSEPGLVSEKQNEKAEKSHTPPPEAASRFMLGSSPFLQAPRTSLVLVPPNWRTLA